MLTMESSSPRDKPIITTGTRMVVRRPDGLGTAQVGLCDNSHASLNHPLGPSSSLPSPAKKELVRPHSTIQRAHSTVIPRSKKKETTTRNNELDKKIDAKNIDSIMNKLVSNGAKMYQNGEKGANGNKGEKPKKQRKRVGVNPVLGNAGTMWEPSKKVPQMNEPDLNQFIQKRKSPTLDVVAPSPTKKTKIEFDSGKIKTESKVAAAAAHHDLGAYTSRLVQQSSDSILAQQPDLSTLLQQYSSLQAATGLANNENAKQLLGGLESQSAALLQLHILHQLQKTQQKLQSTQLDTLPSWSSSLLSSSTIAPPSSAITPIIPEQLTSPLDSPYRITPKVEKSNSRVKCFKTAIIPSLSKAELDCSPKITSYQGVKMASSLAMSKLAKSNGPSSQKSKSMNSTKSATNTCILPKIPGYTIEPTTVLNVLGENEKPFREFIQSALKKSSGSISASITLTNHDGEVRHFNCACLQSPQATAYKNVVDVVPVMSSSSVPPPPPPITTDTEEITYAVNSSPPKRRDSSPKSLYPRKLSMSSITEFAITPSISSSSSSITVNLPTPAPPPPPPPPVAPVYKITPVSTSSSGFEPIATVTATPSELMPPIAPITLNPALFRPSRPIDLPKKINLNFPSLALAHSALTAAAAAVNKQPFDFSPASSPEIIVDELEKSPPPKPGADSGSMSRGPKKNFLARQAALDAKLNVLRIRAEKTTSDESKVSLEMSDDEVIQHQ